MKHQTLFIRAVSTDGKRLGAAVDANIDEQTLRVKELAINTGWFDRISRGLLLASGCKYDPVSARVIVSLNDTETEVEP